MVNRPSISLNNFSNLSRTIFVAFTLILTIPVETIATTYLKESNSKISTNSINLSNTNFKGSAKYKIAQSEMLIRSRAKQFLTQGAQLYSEKKISDAVVSWQKALNLYRQIRDVKSEGLALGKLGIAFQDLGQYRKAIQHFDIALPILQQANEKIVKASILGNLGNSHLKLGNFSNAISFYKKSIALWQELSDPANEGKARRGLGNIYITLGNYSDALAQHRQALRLALATNSPEALSSTYNSLGLIHSNKGQDREAHQFYQKGLASAQTIQDSLQSKLSQAQILSNLGYLELAKGDHVSALASYQKGLSLATTIKDKILEASALLGIGSVYTSRDEHSKALTVLQRSFSLAEGIYNSSLKAKILHLLGATHWQLEQFNEAELYFNSAVTLLDDSRENLDDIDKVSIFETQVHSYALLRRVLAEQGKFPEALEASERGRSRAFIELLSKRQASNNLSPLLRQDLLPNLPDLLQVAQQQNATLVEYAYVADEKFVARGKLYGEFVKIYIWVIKPNGNISFREVNLTPTQTNYLQQAGSWANQWKESVEDRLSSGRIEPLKQEFQKLHQDLYSILIAPIADQLPSDPSDPVIFIPYRELFQVSFPALQAPDGTYLVQKHTILTAPAIQVIELTHQLQTNKATNTSNSLVIGNPTMPTLSLEPLEGAEQEAKNISHILNTQALIGDSATETIVKQRMGSARIIHFATHGLLNEVASESGVPGAIALASDSQNDGFLQSDEILDLKLNADLVVVSACDTGRGQLTGDGVVGLSRSIMAAGVPNVMVTLWSTSDESTALLMEEFYRLYSQNPNKAQALRQAMLKTMEVADYSHPVFWAPFNLVGQAR